MFTFNNTHEANGLINDLIGFVYYRRTKISFLFYNATISIFMLIGIQGFYESY